ncbi:MAG TPA: MurR/RpiR family transcriptional regulator [Burkholderiaceae bacterium]|nr:MurR/RpiR family transcriptional regulator [Burkholderiaceae bacterium]
MTAATFDELKEAIAGAYPALPKQLQRIARFALDRPNELALGTVAAVAEAAGVQPSAMIRFANALDYGGFSQMQQVFREHLVERSTSYRDRIAQLRRSSGRPKGEGGVLHQFVSDAVAELGQLDDNVKQTDLHAAVMLLCRAERVHVLAQRRAFPIAAYLTYALGQLELRTQLLDGIGGMLDNGLRSIALRDLLLVTSFHSYSPEVVDAAAAAHARGVPVIAITDSAFSPLKASARVCFELGGGSEPAFRSLVAPLCLAQALVVGVGHRLAEVATQPAPKRRRNGATS